MTSAGVNISGCSKTCEKRSSLTFANWKGKATRLSLQNIVDVTSDARPRSSLGTSLWRLQQLLQEKLSHKSIPGPQILGASLLHHLGRCTESQSKDTGTQDSSQFQLHLEVLGSLSHGISMRCACNVPGLKKGVTRRSNPSREKATRKKAVKDVT